ncbi:Helicase, C-terminal [Penicillium expansum]|nr:Helicase, C-terminal [Penicillium expansum]
MQMNHGSSGLPWFSVAPSSPEPDMKSDLEAMDAPLRPDVTDGLPDSDLKDEPLNPDVTNGLPDTEVKDEPLDSEITDEPIEPDMSHMTAEPLETHTSEATDTHMDQYIPAGILRKFSSQSRYPDSEIALLEKHEWIRTRSLDDSNNVQVFVLPNAPQKKPIKKGKRGETNNILLTGLKLVMSMIDSSPEAWNGLVGAHAGLLTNTHPGIEEEESLYYIYNTLQEPKPNLDEIADPHSWRAMGELLGNKVRGLKTQLHPFQRESAAVMVQREAQPALALDPRFQPWQGPTGLEFYYDRVSGSIMRDKILYPEACGGILAESMGCGKTLISLAVILATRGHFPKIPVEYQKLDNPIRSKTGTLMEMAAAAAGRFSLPWKDHFDRLLEEEHENHDNCRKACVAQSGSYDIPARSDHQRAKSHFAESAKHIRLCSGTLVIVPDNLMDHWEREITTHTSDLKFLVLQNQDTPSTDELLDFDIVLFSKSRCIKENAKYNKNGRKPDAPILNLHWLRVIVDEGHNLAGKTTGMVDLLKNLKFERRWMISGTPLSEMYGVELSIASLEVDTDDTESSPDNNEAAILQKGKKAGNAVNHEIRNLDKLGDMIHDFFSLKPWANNTKEWPRYTRMVGEDGIRRKSPSLRATLQSLVVRHRYETVKKEITLPPLYNKVVYLEPTFYDRLYINIFLFTLAVNAITSEREGPDYMFGESDGKNEKNKKNKNKAKLTELIQNLRLAGFWWAGDDNVQSSVDIALEYLEENQEKMTVADFNQLKHGIQIARKAINSPGWNGFKKMHELGVFVRHFPEHARNMWALDPTEADHELLLMGITQARRAQQFVMNHLTTPDPADGLAGEGIKVRRELVQRSQAVTFAHSGAPESANAPVSKSKSKGHKQNQTSKKNIFRALPKTSPLAQTKLEGVASAKLRYLLDQVLKFQKTEKIIIFYEHDNVASWVEQGLELIAVKFRTYASTASMGSNFKTEHLREFRETEEVRVLLMSVKQASHGLHIPEASRMYIVNPIWERNVESQAIKRAHRIGQKRPVFVETLVLGNTLEYRMLNRSKNMTAEETKQAGDNPLNDSTMSDIIKNEPFLPMPDEASAGMAPLAYPLGLFDQHKLPQNPRPVLESDTDFGSTVVMGPSAKRRRIGFAEHDQVMGEGAVDAVPGPLQTVPELNSTSEPSRIGFTEREMVVGDSVEAFGASGSVQFVPMHSGSDLSGNGVQTRPSIFGPF